MANSIDDIPDHLEALGDQKLRDDLNMTDIWRVIYAKIRYYKCTVISQTNGLVTEDDRPFGLKDTTHRTHEYVNWGFSLSYTVLSRLSDEFFEDYAKDTDQFV